MYKAYGNKIKLSLVEDKGKFLICKDPITKKRYLVKNDRHFYVSVYTKEGSTLFVDPFIIYGVEEPKELTNKKPKVNLEEVPDEKV